MKENAINSTSKINGDKVDALSEEDIHTSDFSPLTDDFFAKPQLYKPKIQRMAPLFTVSVQIDKDTLAWFEAQGGEKERRRAAALRVYADAHKAVD